MTASYITQISILSQRMVKRVHFDMFKELFPVKNLILCQPNEAVRFEACLPMSMSDR
jgi:hypothetical protein